MPNTPSSRPDVAGIEARVKAVEGRNNRRDIRALIDYIGRLESAIKPFVKFIKSGDGLTTLTYAQGKAEEVAALFNGVPDDYVLLRPSPEVHALTLGDFRALAALGDEDG